MVSKFPSQEMDRFNVRLPNGMREAIAERAKQNGRSMNSEIVHILEDALNRDPTTTLIIDDLESHITPHILDKENGLAAHLRMLAQLVDEQLNTDGKQKRTPLETLKQNRPTHKSRKDGK